MPTTGARNGLVLYDLRGASYDDPKWEQLLDQLSVDDMVQLIGYGGYGSPAIASVGKLKGLDADGPAGISARVSATLPQTRGLGYPSEIVIAATWNTDMAKLATEGLGAEASNAALRNTIQSIVTTVVTGGVAMVIRFRGGNKFILEERHENTIYWGGNIIEQDILIVLSPKEYPEQLCSILANRGMSATVVQDVQTALETLKLHNVAFLLLDLDLEGAISFLEKVVETFYDPPPYILAADAFPCSLSQAEMLNLGADACLEKPLDMEEVAAKINAVLRRAERLARPGPLHGIPPIKHSGLSIDPLRRRVDIAGIVFSKEQIYEHIWDEDYRYATTSVSDLISSLRKKLGLNARDNRYIQTVYGVGYRFANPE